MLTFNVILGYQGLLFQDFLRLFCFLGFFFFNPTDRPTQYQETHSTLNEKKKGDGLMLLHIFLTGFTSLIKPSIFVQSWTEVRENYRHKINLLKNRT